jgi:hypothetical protein
MPDLFLLHFATPYHHARHYLGYAVGTGRGAAYAKAIAAGRALGPHELVMAAQACGVELVVADVLVGEGRDTQRALRRSHNLARHCPICLHAAQSDGAAA